MKLIEKRIVGKTVPEAQKILDNEEIMNPFDERKMLKHIIAYRIDGVYENEMNLDFNEGALEVDVYNSIIVQVHFELTFGYDKWMYPGSYRDFQESLTD